jgi:hypothetical protein
MIKYVKAKEERMHEQSLSAETQRIASLHFQIADFIGMDPYDADMMKAVNQAQTGEFAVVGVMGGEFKLDNSDSRRTPIDNHFALMRRNANFRDAQNALHTVANFDGPIVTAEDFNDPENDATRRELLASQSAFAVSNTVDGEPEAESRTLWVPLYDRTGADGQLTRLPLYRRVTGPVYYDNARPITLISEYVVPPFLQITERASAAS